MGIKVALAVFSSYTNDDIDRIDKVSPTQVITEKGCEDYHQNIHFIRHCWYDHIFNHAYVSL